MADEKTPDTSSDNADRKWRALERALDDRKTEDPLIKIKAGGQDVLHRLMQGFKGERGVHAESLLCALGALSGYACQVSALREASAAGNANQDLMISRTQDGRAFLFGDALNAPLAESKYSIWSMAAGAAQHAGCTELPDVMEIFRHVSATVGAPEFGIPRLPDGQRPAELPIAYLSALWPVVLPAADRFCDKPADLPMVFGYAIQLSFDGIERVLDPALALRIVMESAIPMSKVWFEGNAVNAGPDDAKAENVEAGSAHRAVGTQQSSTDQGTGAWTVPRIALAVALLVLAVCLLSFLGENSKRETFEMAQKELKMFEENSRANETALPQVEQQQDARKSRDDK